ncbi:hypothetical protein TeGR_g2891 [Tetraparma gracilis]|uniref:Transmembrane protein n=1 Tax=Tetraparma gracilis TaxID=2962635 RepID=A0ABQ6M484_9STRA|nr:hypothetical protein TeGR_g2891 [Tetraparma gracilis]
MVSYQLHFFSVLLSVFVTLHRPTSPPGFVEILSNALLIVNRAIFLPDFFGGDPAGFTMFTNCFDLATTAGMIALVFSKRRLCSKLSRRKLGGLLFSVIPSATMSVLTSLTFLLGETSGCLMRRYGNSALCNDKVLSGTVFAFTFLCAGIVQIAVLPFHMTDHGIEHFVKFDFRFREQMQLILFAVASLGALYCYSSAQEITDMELWMNPEGFTMGCDFMRRLLYSTIVLFLIVLMATIAGRDHGAATEDSLSLTAKLRARMRTKSFVELAPGLRALLLASLAFVALPSLAFFVLTLVSGDEEVKYKMYMAAVTTQPSVFAVATFYFMSKPRAKKYLETPVIIFSVSTSAAVVYSAYRLDKPYGGTAAFVLLVMVGFRHISRCRAFLALHSDDSIQIHLQSCVTAATAVLGPAVYLMGETIGCLSVKGASECDLIFNANFCVNIHLMCHLIFSLLVSYTFQKLTWTDLVTYRGCDFTTYFRLNVTGTLTVISFFIFGMRPKDSTATVTDVESQYLLLNVTSVMKYVTSFLWIVIFVLFYYPVYYGKVVEKAHVSQDWDDHDSSKRVRCWQAMEKRCKVWFDKLVIPHETLRVSPSHTNIVLGIAMTPLLLSCFYYATSWTDMSFNVLVWKTGYSFVPACVMYGTVYGYCFIDVEDNRAIKVAYMLPVFYTAMSTACHLASGSSPTLSVIFMVLFAVIGPAFMKERTRAVKKIEAKYRRRHLYGVVTVIGASELPPCIFMSSEYISCLLRAYVTNRTEDTKFSAFGGGEPGTACDSLIEGIFPIMVMIVCGGLAKIIDVHYEGKEVLTLKKIMTLTIPADVRSQLLLGSLLSCWAIVNFGMRSEGYETVRGKASLVIFVLLNTVMIFLPAINRQCWGGCLKKEMQDGLVSDMFSHSGDEDSEEEGGEGEREGGREGGGGGRGGGGARGAALSIEDRNKVGGSSGIWDGGTRGASKSVQYKQYMSRLHGVKEKGDMHREGGGEGDDHHDLEFEDDEFDFGGINPGLL